MSTQEILHIIQKLPLSEQYEILAALMDGINNRANANQTRVAIPVNEIRGIAKPDKGKPPTDEEIEEGYAEYLLEKYS